MDPNLEFKVRLLLQAIPVKCPYFQGDMDACKLSDYYDDDTNAWADGYMTCNCDGKIDMCDLPEKYQRQLV